MTCGSEPAINFKEIKRSIMPKKTPKMPPKGMHEMKGGMMMPDAKMPWMAGKSAPKKGRGKKKGKK